MRCEILIDPHLVRRWVAVLVARLRAKGHDVIVKATPGATRAIPALAIVEPVEDRLYRSVRPLGGRMMRGEAATLVGPSETVAVDLSIDLTDGTSASTPPARLRLALRADGRPLEAGIAAALLERRPPRLTLEEVAPGGRCHVEALPAVPDAAVFVRALEGIAARCLWLVEEAIARIETGDHVPSAPPLPMASSPATPPSPLAGAGFVAATFAEKLRLKLRRMHGEADRWTVGWREVAGDPVIERLAWPEAGYTWLPDDGKRYYADPFVFADRGRRYLFVEEYVYATRRGHLSVAEWTGSGWTVPRAILERPYHLSWPRVFRHGGEIWMLPETSEVRTLELYRAVDFPVRWELASVLATDMSLADATTIEDAGRTWMLAAIADGPGASSWDALAVLEADGPTHPFRLTGDGPRLVDVEAARPAGDIVRVGAEWRRPVQDCALGYGSALGIARIDRLDAEGFRQTMLARLAPDPKWGAIGVHTLNMADGIEVIDINRGFDIARRPPMRPLSAHQA